jgi:hypothetical protein
MNYVKHIAAGVLAAALLAPAASANHSADGYGVPRAMPSDYVKADASDRQVALPRAMPSDYVKADASDRQFGIPRAMPSHYVKAGVDLGRQVGLPRAMPSDYAAAGISVSEPRSIGDGVTREAPASRNTTVVAVGVAGVVLLAAFALTLLGRRRFAA